MHNYALLRRQLREELSQKGITDKKVLNAIATIPREHFVLENYHDLAYTDQALPSVGQQTISQPYTVAFMLQLLEVKKGMKILEIGTGSGYNAALLSLLAYPGKVFTCEINKQAYVFGKKNLEPYKNVYV
ncbi:MAG: protein-L-isoaspartate O-methyltransferase, partial [Nanoarchaeota archaeon]